MDLRCLGTLEARIEDVPVDLGEPQRRLVLALLLSHAGTVVSTDRLADAIWGDDPPASSRKIVQGYVSGLRKALGGDSTIDTRNPGYLLDIKPQETDAGRFEALAAQGASVVRSEPGHARVLLEEALSEWRGQPYEDLADHDVLRPEITRLEQLRLTAVENRAEAEIFAGGASAVVDELGGLIDRYPLRERFWTLRMLALYRSGRQAEALRAYEDARRYLASEVGLEPSVELQLISDRILQQDPILETAAALDVSPESQPTSTRNPSKGLRAFEESDAHEFFGRDDLIRRLEEMLQRRGVPRLVVLTGASGSGKSSVVRAGLIPLLRRNEWSIASMYPGPDPLGSLRAATDAIDQSQSSVVVIDQFEEIYTLDEDREAQRHFLNDIVRLVDPSGPGSWVVATIRADFLDEPMGHRAFAELLDDALLVVTPLADHEIRDVVVQPASLAGVAVEPDLVATIVQEVAHRPAALPLLEFALTDLYDRSRGGQLTLDAYRAAGGLSGALVHRVEEIYASFDETQQHSTRQLLLRLVALGEDAEPTRRRVAFDSIVGLAEIGTVLDLLGEHRLLTFDRDAEGSRTVEVAHEALLREWPRLRGWIEESTAALRSHARLAASAAEWEASDRNDAELLSGARLARFADWDDTGIALTDREREYLDASVAHAETMRARRRRTRNVVMAGFAAAAVVALVLAGVAFQNSRTAEARADEATAEAWAASSSAVVDEDPELAVLLAIEALELAPDSASASAALNRALQEHRTVFAVRHDEGFRAVGSISPDGTLLATTAGEAKLEVWEVGDVTEPLWQASLPSGHGYHSVMFTEDGSRIVVFEGRTLLVDPDAEPVPVTVQLLDPLTGAIESSATVDDPCVSQVPERATNWNGYAVQSGRKLALRDPIDPESGACSFQPGAQPDLVAVDHRTGEVELLLAGIQFDRFSTPTTNVDASRFGVSAEGVFDSGSAEAVLELGNGAATLDSGGTRALVGLSPMRLVDVATGNTLREYPGDYPVAYFSPSEQFVIASDFDGSTRLFMTDLGNELFELRGSGSRDLNAQVTNDDQLAATFSGDGTARVWDIGSQLIGTESEAVFGGTGEDFVAQAAAVTTDDLVLMPIGNNGTRRTMVFDITDGTLLHTLPGRVAAVSPDGTTTVMQSWPGTAELPDFPDVPFHEVAGFVVVDLTSGAVLRELPGICTWFNSVEVEVPGPDCVDGPEPWMEWVLSGSISPDGNLFAMGGASGYAAVWDLTTGEMVHFVDSLSGTNELFDGHVVVEFSPSGERLVVHRFGWGGQLVLQTLRTDTWMVDDEIADLEQPLATMQFRPDGSELIAVDWASNVLVIDTDSWKIAETLEGQQGGQIRDVAVSPDGRFAATAALDGASWLWDLETRAVASKLEFAATIPVGGLYNVEFVSEETLFVSGYQKAVLMTLDSAVLVAGAKARLTRTFMAEECETFGIDPCPESL